MQRRLFLAMAAMAATPRVRAEKAPKHFDLSEATIADLSKRSARELTERYLTRIKAVDRRLRSVIEINPDALRIADDLDRAKRSGTSRGPLHGIPILIKDNIDTADRMSTSAGSLALDGSIASRDAYLVERLRAAGAVILGKTNLSEWANFRSNHSVSGWSARGGQTRNPYALDRNPCGSSSGSGVAVSANLCAMAVGTETDGSIVCPSSMNGIVGIKPTVGLVSRAGIIPISVSQDTSGPMARTVRDAAILLGAMAGPPDPRDPATQSSDRKVSSDYTQYLLEDGLRGARLGVARKYFGFSPDTDQVMESAIAAIKARGAEIVDPVDLERHGYAAENDVLQYEFKAGLNAYLQTAKPPSGVKTLSDLIAFNESHRDREMPWFGQDIFIDSDKRGPLTDKAYLDARAKCVSVSRAEGIDALVAKHKLDAIVGPTAGPAWVIDWINGDHDTGGSSTPAAVAGYPHITVPAGFVHGLPVGISFFGPAWSEPVLLRLAYGFEQATKARREPMIVDTLQPTR